ncbi:MAG: hypothetical protein ABI573_02245, partial [Chloroflexota bacterium]
DLQSTIRTAAEAWAADVRTGAFPGPAETVRMDEQTLDEVLGRTALDRASGDGADATGAGMGFEAGIPLDRDL